MAYEILATGRNPALIIYLIDISISMRAKLDGIPKIEHVNQAIEKVLIQMVQRSTKGELVSPRYRLAMYAYSDQPMDILGGVQPIDYVAKMGKPTLSTHASTNTAAAFAEARDLLKRELPNLQGHPAPMVCHLTDGEYNWDDPEPIAQEIMQMSNDDGNVLVENIFIGENLTQQAVSDSGSWTGIQDVSELKSQYAQKLFRMSSPLPDSYAEMLAEDGYELMPGSRMLIPGTDPDLIELAFSMSGATPTQ